MSATPATRAAGRRICITESTAPVARRIRIRGSPADRRSLSYTVFHIYVGDGLQPSLGRPEGRPLRRNKLHSKDFTLRRPTAASTAYQLTLEKIDDALERIEAERGGDRWAQIRVRVDVVEHPPSVLGLEILDAADVQFRGAHDLPRGVHRVARHLGERVELDGGRFDR